MNYKIRVKNETESKEVQGLLFELGYIWLSGAESPISLDSPYLYTSEDMGLWCGDWHSTFNECGKKKLTIPQLKDMVVLKRNDVADATHKCIYDNIPEYFMASDGVLYFYENTDWVRTKNAKLWCDTHLKPITKEPVMKEFLVKSQDGKWRLEIEVVGDPGDDIIEVPEGADTLAGDERTHYFWKHGVGKKGNMVIGVGESLTHYSGWTDCEDSADVWLDCVNDDSFKIIWQRETLNDKVASAEVARQEFIGVPFSDLPDFNFEAADVVDVVDESNVEQTLSDRESTYGSFKDVAVTTSKLMGVLLNSKNGQMLPCTHQEALHMICSKMARIVNGDCNYKDNWHDIGGYAKLIENLIDGV